MTEHDKVVRVIAGLEWIEKSHIGVESKIAVEALALIRPKGAQIITVDEIKALEDGSVVWVEFSDGRLLPMLVEDGCLHRWLYSWRICDDVFYDEDYKARAWTSRPTDAQREATKWE